MRVKRFVGEKLHGYINVDVEFYSDLTFLYGINGSGKTTVVRLIHALLAPSYRVLLDTQFHRIELTVDHNDKVFVLSAEGAADSVNLSLSTETETLRMLRFVPDPDMPPSRTDELRSEWYSNVASQLAAHVVVKAIEELPTPMYLGLERRVVGGIQPYNPPWTRSRALRQPVFSSSLQASLEEASYFASNAFQRAYSEESELKDTLRNELILSAFDFADVLNSLSRPAQLPSRADAAKIISSRDQVVDFLSSIGFSDDELKGSVYTFFEGLQEIIESLPEQGKRGGQNAENQSKITRYLLNKWQFEKVSEIVGKLEKFRNEAERIYASISSYERLINNFLSASKKRIDVSLSGLSVQIQNVGSRPLSLLSSGEQQLVVLLTQLWFNPHARAANVLIIDEPELSLHLAWQEMFVEALIKANANLQLVLATHSPTIISDRDDRAVEMIPDYVSEAGDLKIQLA
jgi:energy-coupling factor transporter ATP-binding protein EcfA2